MANSFTNIAPAKSTGIPYAGGVATSSLGSAMNNVASGTRTNTSTPVTAPPSTPLKSTTVNNTDGSSITHTYHAPSTDSKSSPSPSSSGITQDQVMANLKNAGYSTNSTGILDTASVPSSSAYQTGGNQNASPNLVGTKPPQAGGSNTNYPTVDSNGNPIVKNPPPINNPSDSSYPGLISASAGAYGQSAQVAQEAAQLRQAMAREKQDVLGNPYYSGSVKIGQSGIIDQTQGSQLSALAEEQQALQGQASGLGSLAGTVSPVTQFGVLTDPRTGLPVNGGSAQSTAFSGGQTQNAVAQGTTYANNKATLNAINAPNTGMVDTFNSALKSSGLNTNDTTILNALGNAFNGLTATQYPTLQSGFNNIVGQYAKILGPQKFNSLLQSAKGSTINDFFNILNNEANAVQNSLYSTGTGTNTNPTPSTQSNSASSSFTQGQTAAGGALTWNGTQWVPSK